MDTHNFVLAITTGLLTAPSHRMTQLFDYFDARFALEQTQDADRASVIVQDCSALRVPLKTWVQQTRLAGATAIMHALSPRDMCGEAYKMAGLVGGRPWTLAIGQQGEAMQFLIGTVSGAQQAHGDGQPERPRVHFGARAEGDLGWQFIRDESAGVAYALFQRPDMIELNQLLTPELARRQFDAALAETQDFALRVGSGFSESFRLALLLSEKSAQAGLAALDQGALRVEVAEHFPTDDQAWLDKLMAVVDAFAQFNWGAAKVLGLAAISAADVFGATGSWNDQSFDGTDQALFESLSARLYDAMNDYFAALLSA